MGAALEACSGCSGRILEPLSCVVNGGASELDINVCFICVKGDRMGLGCHNGVLHGAPKCKGGGHGCLAQQQLFTTEKPFFIFLVLFNRNHILYYHL